MTPLEKDLRDRIAAEGPLPFAAFMAQALYHPKFGYYTSAVTRVGWRGHYLTSPELDPAFGVLWARGFERVWEACGSPPDFTVIEVGPGEGTFAHAVLSSVAGAFADALSYVLVERSPVAEQRQRSRLDGSERTVWTRSITELGTVPNGCVFSNEVLDNLPVHLLERRDGELLEVCVDAGPGGLHTSLRSPGNPELIGFLDRIGIGEVPEGHRIEATLAAESFVGRISSAVTRGALVFVDYGATADDLVTRPEGTLVCYSETGVDDRPLERPGEKDITTHANWTAVANACRRSDLDVLPRFSQRDALSRLGLHDLHEELKREHADAIAQGRGVDALRSLSRRQALGALADPSGLGRLEVLVATKGIPAPAFATP